MTFPSRRSLSFMRLSALALVLVTALLPAISSAEAYDAAHAMIGRFNLGKSLETIGLIVAKRSTAYGLLVQKLGEADAQALVKSELAQAAPGYQEKWNENLVATYTDFFSGEEIDSLAKEGPYSRFTGKLSAELPDIGKSMQGRSHDLLYTFVLEALAAASTKAGL